MAHRLLKALERPSAYATRQTDFWDEITDRIEGALYPAMLDEIEVWLVTKAHTYPGGWEPPIAELIERKREALADEDIGLILRARDF